MSKKIFFIIISLVLISYLAGKAFTPSPEPVPVPIIEDHKKDTAGENKTGKIEKFRVQNSPSEHVNQNLSCKSCHASEYPTKNDPGLMNCPRAEILTDFHSVAEGPEIVVIDKMSENYSGVVFSHKIHSEMSEMSDGCTGCHHYNTTGPVLNCSKCHAGERFREDISIPDLKAAYHRQCMKCHKQWSSDNGCNTQCHSRKGTENARNIKSLEGKKHPELVLPTKMVWETKSKINKTVTFFHDEHIGIFKIECTSCHSQENCINCHAPKARSDFGKITKIEKSIEEHHKPCSNCHTGNSCQKCHQEKEMASFSHGKTSGWVLKAYHSKLECSKCHGNKMPYRKLDNKCISCHKDFAAGFNHELIGISFSESHKELECKNCHTGGDFVKSPVCSDCHDDKSFPADVPGKRVKN